MSDRSASRVRGGNQRRAGAVVVEFAVCLPVIIVLVVGAIESTSMTFLQNSLQVIAYETVRAAVRPDATDVAAHNRADQVIRERAVQDVTVTVQPTNLDAVTAGTPVTVTVTAATQSNGVLPLQFFGGAMTAQAVMIKE